MGWEELHSFISLNIMVDSLAYHALHWFKYALQQCVYEEELGGAGKQARGCSDVSAVGGIGINIMSFLSPDKC